MEIRYEDLSEGTIVAVQELNLAVLQIIYTQAFYKGQLKFSEVSRVAVINGKVAGAILCRPDGSSKLYIVSIAVYADHRDKGIGTALVTQIVEVAKTKPDITEIYLHVKTTNEDAIKFYTQRCGFKITGTVTAYYRDNGDAYILSKSLQS